MKRILFAIPLLAVCVAPAVAQKKTAKKPTKLQEAYARWRAISSKYQAVHNKVTKNAELVKLRKAWNAAETAVRKKVESLSVKERQAEKVARDALSAAIDKQIASSKEIAALKKKREALQKEARDLRFQVASISVQLYHGDSPVQQQLDADPSLAALRKAAWKGTRKERSAAFRKYTDARRAKLKTLKSAKRLLSKVDALNKEIAAAGKQSFQVLREIGTTERKIRYSKDKSLQPLRDKLAAAGTATRKVYFHPDTKDLRAAAGKASTAYRKKYRELTSASKELAALQKQFDAASKALRALRSKPKSKTK